MFHQSSSQYGGTIIAIDHVFILERVKIPEIKKRELSTIYCRNGDDSNGRETDAWSKNPQRKKTISLEAYELLAKTLFEGTENRDIFAHLFQGLD